MCGRIAACVLKEVEDFERETGIAVTKVDVYPEHSKVGGVLRRVCRACAELDV